MRLHPGAFESAQGAQVRWRAVAAVNPLCWLLAMLVRRLPGCLEESPPLQRSLWCWHILPESCESSTPGVVLGENTESSSP